MSLGVPRKGPRFSWIFPNQSPRPFSSYHGCFSRLSRLGLFPIFRLRLCVVGILFEQETTKKHPDKTRMKAGNMIYPRKPI